jgi:hypothetical protein
MQIIFILTKFYVTLIKLPYLIIRYEFSNILNLHKLQN